MALLSHLATGWLAKRRAYSCLYWVRLKEDRLQGILVAHGSTQQAWKLLVFTLYHLKLMNVVSEDPRELPYRGPGNGHVVKRA